MGVISLLNLFDYTVSFFSLRILFIKNFFLFVSDYCKNTRGGVLTISHIHKSDYFKLKIKKIKEKKVGKEKKNNLAFQHFQGNLT